MMAFPLLQQRTLWCHRAVLLAAAGFMITTACLPTHVKCEEAIDNQRHRENIEGAEDLLSTPLLNRELIVARERGNKDKAADKEDEEDKTPEEIDEGDIIIIEATPTENPTAEATEHVTELFSDPVTELFSDPITEPAFDLVTDDVQDDANDITSPSASAGTCSTYQNCNDDGLEGECCPTTATKDNPSVYLDCCIDTASLTDDAKCGNSETCSELGLEGWCCPTAVDVYLDCCSVVNEDGFVGVVSKEYGLAVLGYDDADEALSSSSPTSMLCGASLHSRAILVNILGISALAFAAAHYW